MRYSLHGRYCHIRGFVARITRTGGNAIDGKRGDEISKVTISISRRAVDTGEGRGTRRADADAGRPSVRRTGQPTLTALPCSGSAARRRASCPAVFSCSLRLTPAELLPVPARVWLRSSDASTAALEASLQDGVDVPSGESVPLLAFGRIRSRFIAIGSQYPITAGVRGGYPGRLVGPGVTTTGVV